MTAYDTIYDDGVQLALAQIRADVTDLPRRLRTAWEDVHANARTGADTYWRLLGYAQTLDAYYRTHTATRRRP